MHKKHHFPVNFIRENMQMIKILESINQLLGPTPEIREIKQSDSNNVEDKHMSELRQEIEIKNSIQDEKISKKIHDHNEFNQQLYIKDQIQSENHRSQIKKERKVFAGIGVSLMGILIVLSVITIPPTGFENEIESKSMTSGFVIENLRGDTIDTNLHWNIIPGQKLTVNILNADSYDPAVIEAIKNAILSEDVVEVDNSLMHKGPKGTISTMYEGWKGALVFASQTETEYYIPTDFEFIESNRGIGDITIELTNLSNGDGFSGWTSVVADSTLNEILKSRITIFNVDKLSPIDIEIITKHEMGHALGLSHSSAPEDLMYSTIETNFPYVSDCNTSAITKLYDGNTQSSIECES